MNHLGNKVKKLQVKKGWTQEDLAQKIDVSPLVMQRSEKQGAKSTRLACRELTRLSQETGINSKGDIRV